MVKSVVFNERSNQVTLEEYLANNNVTLQGRTLFGRYKDTVRSILWIDVQNREAILLYGNEELLGKDPAEINPVVYEGKNGNYLAVSTIQNVLLY